MRLPPCKWYAREMTSGSCTWNSRGPAFMLPSVWTRSSGRYYAVCNSMTIDRAFHEPPDSGACWSLVDKKKKKRQTHSQHRYLTLWEWTAGTSRTEEAQIVDLLVNSQLEMKSFIFQLSKFQNSWALCSTYIFLENCLVIYELISFW